MLKVLPDLIKPINHTRFNPLYDSLVQVNILDAGLSDPVQRALGLYLHAIDLYVKSKGAFDYRGKDGHERLKDDAMAFCGSGNPTATRHGDLAAAHLAIDFHDTMTRCMEFNLPLLSPNVHQLLDECRDLTGLSLEMEKRIGLFLDFAGKRKSR